MREFRVISLGHRRVFGVLIPSGVRIEEDILGVWVYHSTQPDLRSAYSLIRSVNGFIYD